MGPGPELVHDPRSEGHVQCPSRDTGHEADVPLSVQEVAHPGPVDAFYKWERLDPKHKQPYAFRRADGDPVVFAGLREWWRDTQGHELNTATIITTEAGPDMPIHNRQPVVLDPTNWDLWLDPKMTDVEKLQPLPVPTVKGTLVHHPVSKNVGNVRNNRSELVEAIALEDDGGMNSL
jgi:putative SOS response-associated peptidase YedK